MVRGPMRGVTIADRMKVFISWSGERSKQVATALKEWLPQVVNALDPWISHADIDPGARWSAEIEAALQASNVAILCLTHENLSAPWIMFEAGAAAKHVGKSKVIPYLFGPTKAELVGPLALRQGVIADEEGTRELLASVNKELPEGARTPDQLKRSFDKWWPDLAKDLTAIPATSPATPRRRALDDMIEEVLLLSRETARELALQRTSGPALNALERLRQGELPQRRDLAKAQKMFGPALFAEAEAAGYNPRDLIMAMYQMELDARRGITGTMAPTVESITWAIHRAVTGD